LEYIYVGMYVAVYACMYGGVLYNHFGLWIYSHCCSGRHGFFLNPSTRYSTKVVKPSLLERLPIFHDYWLPQLRCRL